MLLSTQLIEMWVQVIASVWQYYNVTRGTSTASHKAVMRCECAGVGTCKCNITPSTPEQSTCFA